MLIPVASDSEPLLTTGLLTIFTGTLGKALMSVYVIQYMYFMKVYIQTDILSSQNTPLRVSRLRPNTDVNTMDLLL